MFMMSSIFLMKFFSGCFLDCFTTFLLRIIKVIYSHSNLGEDKILFIMRKILQFLKNEVSCTGVQESNFCRVSTQ